MGFWDFLGVPAEPTKVEAASATQDGYPVASPWASNDLERLTWEVLYGATATDDVVPINRRSAMSVPSVKKARDLICNTVARMPLIAEKNDLPLPTQPTFLGQLQANITNYNTIVAIVDALFFYGRAFVLIDSRLANGTVGSLRFVSEENAEVDEYGILKKAFNQNVRSGSWFRIDAHNEGLLASSATLIRNAVELERVAAEVGANPIPSLVLKFKQNAGQTQVDNTLASWRQKRRARYGSVGALYGDVDLEQIGQAAENLLIEGRNYMTLEVARATGIPAYFLEGSVQGTSTTYTNVRSVNSQLLEAISGYMVTIEQAFSMFLLPYGTKAEFDTSVLLRMDTKERYDAYKVAIDAGFLTENEVREMEGLKPLPKKEVPPALAQNAGLPSPDNQTPNQYPGANP